jgi:flagellar basal-body rod protein FlgG
MPISQLVRSAVSGMMSHKLNIDVIANNLANVNTTGFKAGRVNFKDVLYQADRLATTNPDLRAGAGVRPAEIQSSFTQGALQRTDVPTDLAIYGDGFFQVRAADGTLGYTRDGTFRVDADGRLVTSDGSGFVPDIVVPPGAGSDLAVDADGVVRVTPPGAAASQAIGQIQLARFANPEGLEAVGQNLFRATANSGAPDLGLPNAIGFGQVVQGTLEVSNVSMADEMSNLVIAQRAYGFSIKALQTIDEMVGMANNLRAR